MKLKYIWFVCLVGFVLGCSTAQKSTTPKGKNKIVSDTTENTETDQNQFQYLFVEGLKQKMLGNKQEAVKYFSGCLELDPNSAVSMFQLANIYASNNDFTSAVLLLEKAVSISPDNKWYMLMLARIYQQSRKFDQAAQVYNKLIKKDPSNLDYQYLNALMLTSAGKTDEAVQAYRNMEKKVGINEQISVSVQQLLVDAGRAKEAYTEIQKLIDSNPTESKYYGLLADLYLSQGDKVNALKNYNKILELDPESGYVHFSLANYYRQDGDYEKSFEQTLKAFASQEVDIDAKIQTYLMLVSDSARASLSDEKMGELVKTLIRTNPEDSRVYMIYAEDLIKDNQPGVAKEQLKKAFSINSSDYMVMERILLIDNDYLQDWKALYDDSKNALEYFPNQPQVFFFNGIACLQLEKFKEAYDVCSQGLYYVVDNLPLKGRFIMLQGEAKYKQGNIDEAFLLFDKSVEADPENYMALNNYAYYLSLKGANLDKAERMSGKVVQLFPDNSTYLDTYAWVLFKKKNYQLAKFYMESAIKNGGGDNPVLLEHYGDILFMLDKKAEAKENWLKAKEKGSMSSVLNRKISELKFYENTEE